jgi:hypothetical protein
MSLSRGLAYAAGIVLPLGETIRRWNELGDIRLLPFWADDWLIGGFLLYGAYRSSRDAAAGWPILAAAWGFACGMAYSSFFSTLYQLSVADPSGLPSVTVAAVKGVMLVIAVTALIATLRSRIRP